MPVCTMMTSRPGLKRCRRNPDYFDLGLSLAEAMTRSLKASVEPEASRHRPMLLDVKEVRSPSSTDLSFPTLIILLCALSTLLETC
jgi:hypothetical protein